jgi:pimeloyl-ACP methyl ester carboxylesterase
MDGSPFDSPSPFLLLFEQLVTLEFGAFVAVAPVLSLGNTGKGLPVLVLPPFGTSDWSTAPMRAVLRQKGYATYGWTLGSNIGPHPHTVEGMDRRLCELYERHHTGITLIGWSLGGVYARELARSHPQAVRQVITLGSPYHFRPGDRSNASALYEAVAPRIDAFLPQTEPESARPPLPVPATSIYTRTDGMVAWHACVDRVGPMSENVEVRGSHSGLGFNVAALVAIADRLAQAEGIWEPFCPPPALRWLFPTPSAWRPNGPSSAVAPWSRP